MSLLLILQPWQVWEIYIPVPNKDEQNLKLFISVLSDIDEIVWERLQQRFASKQQERALWPFLSRKDVFAVLLAW